MKYLIALLATATFAGFALAADQDAVKLCTNMLLEKQQQVATANKVSKSQATTYCQCIVPQLENLKKNTKPPSAQELHNIYADCMNKAGMKQLTQ